MEQENKTSQQSSAHSGERPTSLSKVVKSESHVYAETVSERNENSTASVQNMGGDVKNKSDCDVEKIENSLTRDPMGHSHAESGYLTDSVPQEREKAARSSVGSYSSDLVTPCADDLMTFSNSSSNVTSSVTSPASPDWDSSPNTDQTSPDSDQAASDVDHTGQVNKLYDECKEIIDKTSRIEQPDSLVRMNLDCDTVRQKIVNIDSIFATNCQNGRPESLNVKCGVDSARPRSQSEAYTSLYGSVDVYSSDTRKRSKSSAFPIPRQKEGVHISEDMLSKSLPHGKIVKSDSGLIEFIADDLQEKIRRSSPMSKTASSNVSSRRSSQLSLTSVDSMASSSMATSMTSGMSRSYPQSPDCMPPIDAMAIHEIENQARLVADSLDLMMGNLRNTLHQMSAISVGCEEAYRTSVDVTCDSVDASIKAMYAMMAKCEELSAAMQPVYRLADQIKEIKRLLDRFESQVSEKP